MSNAQGSYQDHLDQAQHNEAFLDFLTANVLPSNSRFADWALVVTFYAALHYTKAAILRDHGRFAAKHKGHYDNKGEFHSGHNELVEDYLPQIKTRYRELFDLGQEARYRGFYKLAGDAMGVVRIQRRMLEDIKLACEPS